MRFIDHPPAPIGEHGIAGAWSVRDAIDEARRPTDEPRCAFDRCQAGGVILPKGHRVIGGGQNRGKVWHPGCYDAEHGLVLRTEGNVVVERALPAFQRYGPLRWVDPATATPIVSGS